MKKLLLRVKNFLFPHKHTFDMKEVMNLSIDPKCSCGKTLSEARKEIGK